MIITGTAIPVLSYYLENKIYRLNQSTLFYGCFATKGLTVELKASAVLTYYPNNIPKFARISIQGLYQVPAISVIAARCTFQAILINTDVPNSLPKFATHKLSIAGPILLQTNMISSTIKLFQIENLFFAQSITILESFGNIGAVSINAKTGVPLCYGIAPIMPIRG